MKIGTTGLDATFLYEHVMRFSECARQRYPSQSVDMRTAHQLAGQLREVNSTRDQRSTLDRHQQWSQQCRCQLRRTLTTIRGIKVRHRQQASESTYRLCNTSCGASFGELAHSLVLGMRRGVVGKEVLTRVPETAHHQRMQVKSFKSKRA